MEIVCSIVKKKFLKIDCRPQATEFTVDFIGLRPTKISQIDSLTRGKAPEISFVKILSRTSLNLRSPQF